MNTENQIEQILGRARFHRPAQWDSDIVREAQNVMTPGTKSWQPKWTWKKAASLSAAALLLIGTVILTSPRGSQLAFAQVADKVQDMHSLTATFLYTEPGTFVRVSMQGTRSRSEMFRDNKLDLIQIRETSTGQTIVLHPNEQLAVVEQRRVIPDDPDVIAFIKKIAGHATQPMGEKDFNGRRLVGFSGFCGPDTLGPVNVWVDPQSKLPVRIEYPKPEEGGNPIQDIRFDVAIDDAQFSMAVPPGYRVQNLGWPTASDLKAAPTTRQAGAYVIKPGVGIDDLKFGASREQIVAALGQPQFNYLETPGSGWWIMGYPAVGLELFLGDEQNLREFYAAKATAVRWNANDFPGKTDRGIKIDSSRGDVETIYGKPDRVQGEQFTFYDSLGMTILFGKDAVEQLRMTAPGGPHIRIALSDAARKLAESIVLHPGNGLGDLKFGATREQVIAFLGQPDELNPSQNSRGAKREEFEYRSLGLSLVIYAESGLREIFADDTRERGYDGNAFAGKTDRGIALGSTRAQMEAAYGPPEQSPTPGSFGELAYPKLGMQVHLKQGIVNRIGILPIEAVPTTKPQ